jgi:hypothetical protein
MVHSVGLVGQRDHLASGLPDLDVQPVSTATTYRTTKTARAPKRPMLRPKSKLRFGVISPSLSVRRIRPLAQRAPPPAQVLCIA